MAPLMATCDTCLVILRAGLRSAHHKEEWLREYNLHLALAHGIHPAPRVAAPSIREQLREFWRTFRLPENPNSMEHHLRQA